MAKLTYWYCLEHRKVEEAGGCGGTTRIGPYDTPEQAAQALEHVRKRKEEQDARDRNEDQ